MVEINDDWYDIEKSKEIKAFAEAYTKTLKKTHPGLEFDDFCDMISAKMDEKYLYDQQVMDGNIEYNMCYDYQDLYYDYIQKF